MDRFLEGVARSPRDTRAGFETMSDLLEAQTLLHRGTDQRIDARIELVLKRSAYLKSIAAE